MTWSLDTLFAPPADGERPAIIAARAEGEAEILSAAEIERLSGALAAGLAERGAAPGTPVGLIGPNTPAWIIAWLALARAGAVAVALDDLTTDEEAAEAFAGAGCRLVLASRHHAEGLRDHGVGPGRDFELIALDEEAPDGARPWRALLAEAPLPPAAPRADAPAVMVYTSGTTGKPKSFTLSRANIAANVDALLAEKILRAGDRVFLPLPLHHVYPLVVGLLTPLVGGATVVLPHAVSGPEVVRTLRETRANVMVGVPRLYVALFEGFGARIEAKGRVVAGLVAALLAATGILRQRLGWNAGRLLFRGLHRRLGGALRIMVSGGAKLDPAIVRRLDALGFEVLTGYGLAETASLFTGNRPGAKRVGSEGQPIGGGEIRIGAVEEAQSDEEGIGEIQLKGPSVFSGYRDNEEANAEAFTQDGWFRTGDLGRLDTDGYLTVTGRAKEVIVLGGGKNVFPEELERRFGADPAIAEIAVTEHEGQLVALVRPDVAAIKAVARAPRDAVRVALETAMREVPPYQRLAGFVLVTEPLPRTRLGKYRRFLLPDLYARALKGAAPRPRAELSAEDKKLLDNPAARKVWEILEARYGARGLAMDASPELDLGIDSLAWMGLALEFESRLDLRIGDEALARVATIRDLLREAIAASEDKRGEGKGGDATAGASASEALVTDESWVTPPGLPGRVLGHILYGIAWVAARAVFRLTIEGREHLPRPGAAFMLVPNHASDSDAPFITAALPLDLARRVWWGGEVTRLFRTRLRRTLSRAAHVFPVDERRPQAAVALARAVLARGDGAGWFPESWRTPSGELQDFRPGIGLVLAESEARAVPVHIKGSFEVLSRHMRRPRLHPVRVRFGQPARVKELIAEGEGESEAEKIADALHRRVAALAGEG